MEIKTIRGLRNLKRKKEYSRLSQIEQRVRKSLINYVVNNSIPFNINLDSLDLLDIDKISESSLKEIIRGLVAKKILSMDGEGDINFLYPVSALPTHHRVSLGDGRSFYSMCGIDALGSTMTFNQDVHIESVCSHCGEKIVIEVKDRKLDYLSSQEIHVIHMEAAENEDWAVNCWNFMNYFCTKEHCNTWLEEEGLSDKDIYPVDIRTGFMIGKYAFSEEENAEDSILEDR